MPTNSNTLSGVQLEASKLWSNTASRVNSNGYTRAFRLGVRLNAQEVLQAGQAIKLDIAQLLHDGFCIKEAAMLLGMQVKTAEYHWWKFKCQLCVDMAPSNHAAFAILLMRGEIL